MPSFFDKTAAGSEKDAEAEHVLACWFGGLSERWWKKDSAFDQQIRDKFGATHRAVMAGNREGWLATPRGRLAYLVVLDQLSRNMFRGTPAAFASDARALAVALDGIALAMDRAVGDDGRGFYYMPLMHSENLAMQERCVALFASWCDEATGEVAKRVAVSLRYAEQHRHIVRRFGRFPHRNAILGRVSAPEEQEFLTQPGSSF